MTTGRPRPGTQEPRRGGAPDRARILTGIIVVLAVAGMLIAASAIVGAGERDRKGDRARIGDPADTEFGSLTVTRVSTTFVPDTQGPPTTAQHAGTRGSHQLQVWVRLTNADDRSGVSFGPGQFSLVSDGGGLTRQQASGSSLGRGRLQPGGSIDGQVWFDRPAAGPGRRWLVFAPSGGGTVRVPLGGLDVAGSPSPGRPSSADPPGHHGARH